MDYLIPAIPAYGEGGLENFIYPTAKNLKILEKICQGFYLTFLKNIVKNYRVLVDKSPTCDYIKRPKRELSTGLNIDSAPFISYTTNVVLLYKEGQTKFIFSSSFGYPYKAFHKILIDKYKSPCINR